MRMFTRISTSIMAALDRAVSTIENHDALVEAAINEVRQAVGQARARLHRVQSDSERLRACIVALRGTAEQWAARAVQAGVSEDTALQCLRRRRDCGLQIAQSEDLLRQQQALCERLHETLSRMESRLRELQRQRDDLRAREAAAEVLRVGETFHGSSAAADIDRTLERWDAKIAADELVAEPSAHVDALERSFLADEERRVLSWRVSNTQDTGFCVEALEEALRRYGAPQIFNTDQGTQFTSEAFTDVLKSHGVEISMDRKGLWVDNVFVERLWRAVKYEDEQAYGKSFVACKAARRVEP